MTTPAESKVQPGAVPHPGTAARLRAFIRALRPRQWTKNLLVAAAPAAAGVLTQPGVPMRITATFALFCVAASATYLLNDALDVEADRLHPVKRHRPIAAGMVSVPVAVGAGVVGMVVAVAGAALISGPLAVVVGLYVAMTLAYSVWLKHVVVVDIAVVTGGFILRAVAGGAATGVPLSEWFLIVASFGALFLVAGKRHAETMLLGEDRADHRSTLSEYIPAYTEHLMVLGSGVTAVAYCLWAFETEDGRMLLDVPWLTLSIIPFILVLLRYALLVFAGRGGEPEEIVLRDRQLQLFGLLWAVLVIVGINGG